MSDRPPTGPRLREQPRGERSEDDFELWVTEATERADPVMAWLGVVFALLVGFELAVEVAPPADRILSIAGWSIWAVFVLELAVKLWLAPSRVAFLRRRWLQVVALLVPTLRVFSFLRLLRFGRALPAARVLSSSYRNVGTARRLIGSRLGYVGTLSTVAVVAVAELAYVFERDAPRETFPTFGDAVLWSLSVVLAGQGDPVPATAAGRVVMIAGFAFGVVVVASLAGTIGAFLVDDRRERAEQG